MENHKIEELARRAFLHFHGYASLPEDWEKLKHTQQKWINLTRFILKEASFDNSQQLKQYSNIV